MKYKTHFLQVQNVGVRTNNIFFSPFQGFKLPICSLLSIPEVLTIFAQFPRSYGNCKLALILKGMVLIYLSIIKNNTMIQFFEWLQRNDLRLPPIGCNKGAERLWRISLKKNPMKFLYHHKLKLVLGLVPRGWAVDYSYQCELVSHCCFNLDFIDK